MDAGWNRPGPPGFRGFNPDEPYTVYYRHMPHWRQDGATYFVTFRLADSLPQNKLNELKAIRREWEAEHPDLSRRYSRAAEPFTRRTQLHCVQDEVQLRPTDNAQRPTAEEKAELESLAKRVMTLVESWLDKGMGKCVLRRDKARKIMVDALHHFDGERYELGCYVVMPSHVHALIRPLEPRQWPLEHILQSWKRHTSRRIERGSLWQRESFDRIVRDEEHLFHCIQYIGRNPTIAKLRLGEYHYWIRPQWELLGWAFADV